MKDFLKRSWAVINLNNLAHNIDEIRKTVGNSCMIMGVVKADAYGHGDKFIAEEMVSCGVEWFGVSNVEEAMSLRRHGIDKPILIFGPTPAQFIGILKNLCLTQTVHSLEYATELEKAAKETGDIIDVHIKIDTGMSRLGFPADDEYFEASINEIASIYHMSSLVTGGIFTHFAVADELCEESVDFTRLQFNRFIKICSTLEARGYHFPIKHCCNSAGIINYPEMHMDMVRPGIISYGMPPSDDCENLIDIMPVMSLYSTVSMIKQVKAGTSLSYGRIFTAEHDMNIATVAIGYADGFDRNLSNKAYMLIRGRLAKVVGRVCMDQLMLDVSDIEGVREGDTVTVIGSDGENEITFGDIAKLTGTVNYEKSCLVARRIPRSYVKNGEEIGSADYILPEII